MQRYWDWAQDQFGNATEGVIVTVYQDDGVTPANIYDAATATVLIANPMATQADGFYSFAAGDGFYIIKLSGTGYAERTLPPIYLFDGVTGTPGLGTVTSVDLSAPAIFTVSGNPVVGAGTLALSLVAQDANKFFAGPTTGAAAAPAFRLLHANDIAGLIAIPVTVPSFMSVSDATLGPTDTLGLGFVAQAANKVLAGPASGGAAVPDFRALVPADYPTFVQSGGSHAPGAVPDPSATAGTTKFLCEDATWKNVPYKMQFEMDAILAFPSLATGSGQAITPTGDGSLTIPANTLQVGSRIKVQMILNFTNSATGNLNSMEMKLGGGTFQSAFVTVANEAGVQANVEWDILIDSATSYRLFGRGEYHNTSTTVKATRNNEYTYGSFDITANQAISFQYSINTAPISAATLYRCEILIINPS